MNTLCLISLNCDPLLKDDTAVAEQAEYVFEIAKNLALKSWRTCIFTMASPDCAPVHEISEDCHLYRIQRTHRTQTSNDVSVDEAETIGDKIIKVMAESNIIPDVVHTCRWESGVAGERVAHFYSIPLSFSFAQPEQPAFRDIEERIIKNANAIIAADHVELKTVLSTYATPRHKVHLIPRGVDIQWLYCSWGIIADITDDLLSSLPLLRHQANP